MNRLERPIEDIENEEVRKEVFKLLNIFEEGFLNSELELVICHPINPVDICDDWLEKLQRGNGRNVYCNQYFRTDNCETKKDVQKKVLAYWSRGACKTRFGGGKVTELIQNYIRRGINEYLGTNFSKEEMETIYTYLGNGCNEDMCERFIASKFDMGVLNHE